MSVYSGVSNPHLVYGLKSDPKVKIPANDLADFYEDAMFNMGFKSAQDVLSEAFLSRKSGAPLFNTQQAVDRYSKAQFNVTGGGVPINSTTVSVTNLLREVGTVMDPQAFLSRYVPDVMSQAMTVIVDTVDKIKGVQQDRKQGQPFPEVKKVGNRSAAFTPAYSGEKISVAEQDILALREIGTNNFGIRGIAQYLSIWTEQLAVRMYTKKQLLLQQAIFQGQFSWEGQTFSFGVPSGNTLTPISGIPWATPTGPGGVYVMNPSATPLTDIRYFISNQPSLRRLKPFLKGIAMNRNTHTWFYTNPQVTQLIRYGYMANPNLVKQGSSGVTMDDMIEYFLGGDKKIGVFVDDSQYMADDKDPLGNADNSVNYFIPDGYILFVFDLAAYGGSGIDFVYTPAIQKGDGSFLDARPGMFMLMENLTQSGTFGGYENPSIKILGGFNGMPRISRSQDLFIFKAI
jgi:hypothetical protein